MGSRFREQLTHWTDPAVFTQLDQWKGFLSAMVTAHGANLLYMRNFLEKITKNKNNQGGVTLKDLKPDIFESSEKSKLSFPQWSDEFSSRFRNDVEIGCTDARMGQGQVHCRSSAKNYRLGVERVAEFDKHIYLAIKRLLAGIVREIVDTSKTA